ncbi:nitrate transport permease nrtB [Paenibacillus darwinianus]|uniref:Nitrate transport permease nrtB n=1 Tax=Paenibacillus darwinianus TaxID=1380763 RepID=A0A9W5RZE9_9BACL|nr:ABC transporter permease [Paenibacillus darwinianus]EXX86320.1 nitrate transport permease nrtB [Paenibacillus darwinianus]EXX86422.1 nitrate transport permease nrtB [Paenibacillus darwinianus]EXX88547.1 nitrate transport permease nrtB [Paenibacillus darwinianus]
MHPPKRRKPPRFQIYKDIGNKPYAITAGLSFVFLLAVWSLLSYTEAVNPVFLPQPQRVLMELIRQLGSAEYWNHIGISVFRVSAGFALACLIGIPIGILAGTFKFGEALVEPPMEFIRYMPAVAFIPLIMVWAGIGEWAKILLIFIGCFFQLVLMVADNTRRVSQDLLHASFTLGAGRWKAIETVIIPAIQPQLMNTMRLILGWAWTYLVVAELVAVSSGLGFAIMKAQRFLNTEQIFVGIIVIGLLGLISDRIFAFLNRRLFPWA